jgi:hypothetical protein
MPNTVIALKKSATPAAIPSNLANGELALNYADGKLYYKAANGTIAVFSSGAAGDSFGTVNAAGTLIVADTSGDILTLEAGTNVTITGDAVNDKITISADLSPALLQANTARTHANAAFDQANAAFSRANSALANTSGNWFNGNLTIGSDTSNVYLGDTYSVFNLGTSTLNTNPGFVINQTWNNSSNVFSAFTINVTSTAASASSYLFDVKQNNASAFYVRRFTGTRGEIGINSNGGIWNLRVEGNSVDLVGSQSNHNVTVPGAVFYRSGVGFGIELGTSNGAIIYSGAQEAANTIGQRRGTAGQTSRIYGTYTDASNYERLRFSANATAGYIQTENAGTGIARPLYLGANNLPVITVNTNGRVGIGVSSPTSTLHVIGTANISTDLRVGGNVSFDNIDSVRIWEPAANTLTIHTANTERLRVDASGNVGIGTTSTTYKLEVNGSFAAITKSFVIKHPTKKDMKLRYGSLEGPENGVYVRGRITNSQTIELPDYWHKLIDKDSITVSLTPIGKTQQPSVNKVTAKKITLIGKNIDCFYHVFAERKDVEKLQVEIDE